MRRDTPTTLDRRTHRPARQAPDQGDVASASAAPPRGRPTPGPARGGEVPDRPPLVAEAVEPCAPPPWLRFEPRLEATFQADGFDARKRHLLLCVLLSIVTFAGASLIDVQLLHDIQHKLARGRWPMIALMLGSVALVWRHRGRQPWVPEVLASGNALAIAASIIWAAWASDAITATTHSVAMFCVPVYVCVVALQRFWYAAFTTLACLLGYTLLVHGHTPQEQLIVTENLKMLWLSGSFALLANYFFERNERIAFLLRRQDEQQHGHLEQLRNRLRRQSMVDSLTGIQNRRFLDRWLDDAWQQGDQHRQSLGMLVIDIDCFKAYNDHYGHMAGDQCLIDVARIAAQIAQSCNGHAVRFGGEEFVVVLPSSTLDHALEAGRALCEAVANAHIPHTVSEVTPVITVSVGVASMKPGAEGGPQALLAHADAALYEAKAQGRNRVCACAPHRANANAPARPDSPRHAGDSADLVRPSARQTQIEALLATGLRSLRFPKALEQVYEKTRRHMRRWQLFVAGVVGISSFYVLAESGGALAPDIADQIRALQVDFTLGLTAAVLMTGLRLRTWHRELIYAIAASALGLCAVHLMSQSQAMTVYSYSVVVFLVPAFSAIGARQPLWFAALPAAVTVGAYFLLMEGNTPTSRLMVLDSSLLLTQAVLLSLFGCYTLERRTRVAFLLRLRSRLQRLALRRMSEQLQSMALTDALTGLSNRRQFDLDLDATLDHALRRQEAVSLLLIDVDCFKRYNDGYGHLQGDQCLQHIATVIAEHAAQANGLSARIGGEEFSILLPSQDNQQAVALGKQLCLAVQALNLRHEHSTVAPQVTVSVGTGTLVPRSPNATHRHLLAQADEALYRAKANGRNRAMPSLTT